VSSLSIVLHTHMPYVEGFGTWPFGEEWLWEAIATSYLPLLDLLDEAPGRVTLSLTPVLGDQLEAPGALARCLAFLRELRPASHALDLAEARGAGVRAALERSAARYAAAADALAARGDLLAALARHAGWTSSATHAVLPLLATDAGVRLQVASGVRAFRERGGAGWRGGFWLPECAHAPWLDRLLVEAGVHATCVDWTDVLGPGARAPRRSAAGLTLVPLDREAIDLVWHRDGYPRHAAYRDSHRRTPRDHRVWANDGAVYDERRARERARADARDFVARVRGRGPGPCVVAVDTELLGHFWHEGVDWLRAVLEEAERVRLPVRPLDDVLAGCGRLERAPSAPAPTSWGAGRDLRTWSAPRAGGLAWRQRAAELALLASARQGGDGAAAAAGDAGALGGGVGAAGGGAGVAARGASAASGREPALRELLAAQASDWAFLIDAGTAGDYPRQRVEAHLAAALGERPPRPRNLARHVAAGTFV